MRAELQAYRRRMEKFNHWEVEERRAKSEETLLEEFLILFNLVEEIPEAVIIKSRESHLNHLIAVQKRLAREKVKGEK